MIVIITNEKINSRLIKVSALNKYLNKYLNIYLNRQVLELTQTNRNRVTGTLQINSRAIQSFNDFCKTSLKKVK